MPRIVAGFGVGYDVIGDVHGHAAKLDALLRRLGYVLTAGGWRPPQGRQAIFLGDLIDRGPEQVAVVKTVRSMIDAGHARSVMGNHELNAIGYRMPGQSDPTRFLRPHSPKNIAQHAEFLRQVGEGSALHADLVAWFTSLPPTLDLGGIRVVHAWWHQPYVDRVSDRFRDGAVMDDAFIRAAHVVGSPEWAAIEGLTKGLEIELPGGSTFTDHSGVNRRMVRAKWWEAGATHFRDVAIVGDDQLHRVPDHPLAPDFSGTAVVGSPIFVGHYWMTGPPALQSPKLACVDYSAAKDGPLVAYRWDGETELDATRFVGAG